MTRLHKYIFIFLLFSVFGVMLILNFLTPLFGDDFAMIKNTGIHGWKIGYWHYFNMNGRAVLHSLAYLFLAMPKAVFNICNAFMFTWLTLLIYLYTNPASPENRRYNIPLYLFILFLIGTQSHIFGQTFLWLDGSVNYLWGISIILSFVFIYYWDLVLGRNLFKRPVPAVFFMFLAGFIAGACNENTSGGGILLVLALLLYGMKCGTKPCSWHFSGLVGACAGLIFLVVSPAELRRIQYYQKDGDFLFQLFDKIVNCTIFLRDTVPLLVLIFVVLFIIQAIMNKKLGLNCLALMFFGAGLATVYAMVFAPLGLQGGIYAGGRAMFGATIILMTACAYVFGAIKTEHEWGRILTVSLAAFMGLHFLGLTIPGGVEIAKLYSASTRRDNYVICQREAGTKDLVVPFFPKAQTKYTPAYGISEVLGDKSYWVNWPYALKFGINSIVGVDRKKWDAEYKKINPHCGVPY